MPRRNLSRIEVQHLYELAGIEPPKVAQKYRSLWTYYNGRILHTTGSSCAPLLPTRCPVCTNPDIKTDRQHWYPSRTEAKYAERLDREQQTGRIAKWSRSTNIVLLDGKTRSERITYKPDFDVWLSNQLQPEYRVETKGSKAMISQQSKIRIKLYRAAVERGEQPPLLVVDSKGQEITL